MTTHPCLFCGAAMRFVRLVTGIPTFSCTNDCPHWHWCAPGWCELALADAV